MTDVPDTHYQQGLDKLDKDMVLTEIQYMILFVLQAVADLHTKVSGAPPPTGPNSFIFTYVFTEKHLCQRLAPPPTRVGAPPAGNPGSAPDKEYDVIVMNVEGFHVQITRVFSLTSVSTVSCHGNPSAVCSGLAGG